MGRTGIEWESQGYAGYRLFKLTKYYDGTYLSEPLKELSKEEGIPLPPSPAQTITLASFPSKSDPTLTHYVKYNEALGVFCTCTGFGVYKHCWHVDEVSKKLKERLR
jgi:hypothetical protein